MTEDDVVFETFLIPCLTKCSTYPLWCHIDEEGLLKVTGVLLAM